MTQIRISDELAMKLKNIRLKIGETYEDIIERLLRIYEINKKSEENGNKNG